jgi:hypothetical protein
MVTRSPSRLHVSKLLFVFSFEVHKLKSSGWRDGWQPTERPPSCSLMDDALSVVLVPIPPLLRPGCGPGDHPPYSRSISRCLGEPYCYMHQYLRTTCAPSCAVASSSSFLIFLLSHRETFILARLSKNGWGRTLYRYIGERDTLESADAGSWGSGGIWVGVLMVGVVGGDRRVAVWV